MSIIFSVKIEQRKENDCAVLLKNSHILWKLFLSYENALQKYCLLALGVIRYFLWQIQLKAKWGEEKKKSVEGICPQQREATRCSRPSESWSAFYQSCVCHDLISAPILQTETTRSQFMTDGIGNRSRADFKSLVHHPFYSLWGMAKPPPY